MIMGIPEGSFLRYTLTCTRCGTSTITQCHDRRKSRYTATSIVKTTARTLGWQVGDKTATCGTCRRNHAH